MNKTDATISLGKARALFLCVLVYLSAGAAAYLTVVPIRHLHPIVIVAVADAVATVVVFLFSVGFDNSSMYDPYWSVAPVVIAIYFLTLSVSGGVPVLRQILVMAAICFWAVRLTLNWAVYWPGLHHEDWRYNNIRNQSGKFYWISSFLGIHVLPTVVVFLGCLSLYPALASGEGTFGMFDILGICVITLALFFETSADVTLHRFLEKRKSKKEICQQGLWNYSRHPNYLGEVLFWWGLFFFGFSAEPALLILGGPVVMSLLFLFISIPMMERHLKSSKPGYDTYRETTSMIIPWMKKALPAGSARIGESGKPGI